MINLHAAPSHLAIKQRRSLLGSKPADVAKIKDAAGLRVVALAAEAFGGYGGIAQSTRDLMLAASSMKSIASIDILPRVAQDLIDKLPDKTAQHVPRKGRLAYAAAALRLTSAARPHLLYCGHLFMVPLAASLARLHGAKLIVHLHGLELWEPLTPVRRLALERSDLALCVSHDTKDRLLDATALPPDRVQVIFNTYANVFTPGNREEARQSLGLDGKKVLLTVSRLDSRQQHKGHDAVIPLIPRLRAQGHDVVYLIAGDGDDRPRLERMVCQHKLNDHVRFLARIAPEQMPSLYRAADLYVMPSTGEGFGIAFIEAMASGTPALGLALGGAPDALCDGELGTAVAPEAFPGALERALTVPAVDRATLATAVKARFGGEAFQKRVRQALRRVVA